MWKKAAIAFIVFNIFLSAWGLFQENLYFHTDIARDFLLVEDIVVNKNLTLIGPRSGGIPGVFHGPLWLYLMVPAFALSGGNPVAVGFFWLALSITGIALTYWVGKKIFDEKTGLISAVMMSTLSIPYVASMFNPYGAVMLSPLFVYFLHRYLKDFTVAYLIAAYFSLGIIIHFQMAFGVPLLVVSAVYVAGILWKEKKLPHILSIGAVAVPLVSYLLFELRNNFLQIQSVIKYISGKEDHGKVLFSEKVITRIQGLFVDGWNVFPYELRYVMPILALCVGYILWKQYSGTSKKGGNGENFWRSYYGIFTVLYGGFWAMAFLFSGVIWGYYFWPFVPLVVILVASLSHRKLAGQPVIAWFVVLIIATQLYAGLGFVQRLEDFQTDAGSWAFNYSMAQDIFEDAPDEFGYFIFTPDQFGYTPRYALNYVDRQSEKSAVPYQKLETTYLVIAPAPEYRPELNGEWWRENQVNITREPDEIIEYDNGFDVYRYELSEEERAVEANPDLIQDLTFR